MLIPQLLRLCAGIYVLVIVAELVFTHKVRRFVWQILVLLLLIILAALITNTVTGHVAFGTGSSPATVIGLMFLGVVLGIAARYIFYLKGSFSWLDLLKPLCVSPIALLPLISSVQAVKELATMQVISFTLLAFQNGFFWQVVLEGVKPVTAVSTRKTGE